MLGLIVSLVIAGLAGWIAGNIMKAQPFKIAGSPILGNVALGVAGGFVGRAMLWLVGLSSFNLIGNLVAAVLGAVAVICVLGRLRER